MISQTGETPPAGVSQLTYAIQDHGEGERILAALTERFRGRIEPLLDERCALLDTFDGRLQRAGVRLVEAGRELSWHADGRVLRTAHTKDRPAFARDVAPGAFRDALARVIDVRRLLPVLESNRTGALAQLCNRDKKTVVRVRLECWRDRPPTLRVTPIRGYEKAFQRVQEHLEKDQGLRPAADILASRLLARTRPEIALDPDMRADEAAKAVYSSQLAIMDLNEEGTRLGLDPEFLHEFRVAVRRTRAGLARFSGVFPAATVRRFKREFGWLGGVTGATRDLDVYLIKLHDYENEVAEEVRRELAPLRVFLKRKQAGEQQKLAAALDSRPYQALRRAWRGFLDKPVPRRSSLPNAARKIPAVAAELVWALHRRIIKRGSLITDETPAAPIHDLRIECKKLRYMMEFTRSLFDSDRVRRQIQALKRLQDNLGDFNDLEVQQSALGGMAESMAAEGLAPVETLMAMGRLIEELARRQQVERHRFGREFVRFAAPKNLARARALFAPKEQTK